MCVGGNSVAHNLFLHPNENKISWTCWKIYRIYVNTTKFIYLRRLKQSIYMHLYILYDVRKARWKRHWNKEDELNVLAAVDIQMNTFISYIFSCYGCSDAFSHSIDSICIWTICCDSFIEEYLIWRGPRTSTNKRTQTTCMHQETCCARLLDNIITLVMLWFATNTQNISMQWYTQTHGHKINHKSNQINEFYIYVWPHAMDERFSI